MGRGRRPMLSRDRAQDVIFWGTVSILIHVGVYVAAVSVADRREKRPARPVGPPRHTVVVVNEAIDEIKEPPKPPRVVPASVGPRAKYSAPAVDKRAKHRVSATPRPRSPEPRDEIEETVEAFLDIGVMGSVDVNAMGTFESRFTVATGTSGVGGPIGRSGDIREGTTSRSVSNGTSPTARGREGIPVASMRDISKRAKPRARHNQRLKAPYPPLLRKASVKGDVLAILTVLANGTVGNVEITKSSHDAFARSAIGVLKKFLFEPAVDDRGRPVVSKVHITYRFTLE